jgi:hypothetical protein
LIQVADHSVVVDIDQKRVVVDGVGVNVFESELLPDCLLESADGLCPRNFDGKYVAGTITMDETVEFEDRLV